MEALPVAVLADSVTAWVADTLIKDADETLSPVSAVVAVADSVTCAAPETVLPASEIAPAAERLTEARLLVLSVDSVMLADPITEFGPVLAAKRVLSNHPDAEALSENQPTGSAFLSNSPMVIIFPSQPVHRQRMSPSPHSPEWHGADMNCCRGESQDSQ